MRRLLYLHGVGDDGTRLDWLDCLEIPREELIAPNYLELLSGEPFDSDGLVDHPTRSAPTPQDRHRYRLSQVQLHEHLLELGSESVLPDARRGFGRIPRFVDAIGEQIVLGLLYDVVSRYNDDHRRRRAIRERVLAELPDDLTELVIVAHSLGGMVALDLVQHLPDHVTVTLLVTAASTLARNHLPDEIHHLRYRFPYDRIGVWLNAYNPSDVVTRGTPIGARFPQAIDVSVSASLGNHTLLACVRDPGVAQVIRAAIAGSGPGRAAAHSAPVDGGSQPPLTTVQALHVLISQFTMRMEELLADYPDTTPTDLIRFHEARFVAHESLLAVAASQLRWDDDHTRALRDRVAEQDLPTLLLRLARADPLRHLQISLPADLVSTARARTAMDLGVPPSWLTLASHSLTSVADSPAGSEPGPDDPVPDRDGASGDDPVTRLTGSLAALRSAAAPERLAAELAQIRPVISELLARALLAERLDSPDPGSAERTMLSRIMTELGEHRIQALAQKQPPDGLTGELAEQMSQVATALDWLAARSIGLRPWSRMAVSGSG